jgi:hypothetical protein
LGSLLEDPIEITKIFIIHSSEVILQAAQRGKEMFFSLHAPQQHPKSSHTGALFRGSFWLKSQCAKLLYGVPVGSYTPSLMVLNCVSFPREIILIFKHMKKMSAESLSLTMTLYRSLPSSFSHPLLVCSPKTFHFL